MMAVVRAPAPAAGAGPAAWKHSAVALEEGRFLATRALSAESEQELAFATGGAGRQVQVVVQRDAGPAPAARAAAAPGADQRRLLAWAARPAKAQVDTRGVRRRN